MNSRQDLGLRYIRADTLPMPEESPENNPGLFQHPKKMVPCPVRTRILFNETCDIWGAKPTLYIRTDGSHTANSYFMGFPYLTLGELVECHNQRSPESQRFMNQPFRTETELTEALLDFGIYAYIVPDGIVAATTDCYDAAHAYRVWYRSSGVSAQAPRNKPKATNGKTSARKPASKPKSKGAGR